MKDSKGRELPLARLRHDRAILLSARVEDLDDAGDDYVLFLWYRDDDQLEQDVDVNEWKGAGYYACSQWGHVLIGHTIEVARARIAGMERRAGLIPHKPTPGEVFDTVLSVVKVVVPIATAVKGASDD